MQALSKPAISLIPNLLVLPFPLGIVRCWVGDLVVGATQDCSITSSGSLLPAETLKWCHVLLAQHGKWQLPVLRSSDWRRKWVGARFYGKLLVVQMYIGQPRAHFVVVRHKLRSSHAKWLNNHTDWICSSRQNNLLYFTHCKLTLTGLLSQVSIK